MAKKKAEGKVNIAVIGAGSTSFSLKLVRDICLSESLTGSTIKFMDIDKKRLEGIYGLAKRYAKELKRELKIEKTTDRREALKDAEFVINTALVVSHDKENIQWNIARKHGYRKGYFMNSLVGDEAFFTTFYQLKLIQSIIRDMEKLCPDAWYIQSANPQYAGIHWRTHQGSKVKRVGLCHGFNGIYTIAETIGLKREYVSFQVYGINHFIWLTHFFYKGKDAYPLLDEWIEKKSQKCWENPDWSLGHDLGPKAVDVYKQFGLFPIGDTCTAGGGSWPWWYHTDDDVEKEWKVAPEEWYAQGHKGKKDQVKKVAHIVSNSSTSVTDYMPTKYSESNVAIMDSLTNDRRDIYYVNIPNCGAIPGFADDAIVEIPALVSGCGIQGIHVGDLPKHLMAQATHRIDAMELELEAFLTRDKRRLVEMVLMEPWSTSMKQVKSVLDEIMALPFNREMAEHFNW